jgi:nitroimidazol reductase NimA-like FMN-containing flavoprotein (pyridoxamine 5'-phosphate oxidase superfamily)
MAIEDLRDYGIVRMDDEAIRGFVASHGVGVLGLPADGAPLLRPMSYGFDGESALYFLYVLGSGSQKAALSTEGVAARFLVYSAETPFNWRSVLLRGALHRVPDEERASVAATAEMGWRPTAFEAAGETENTALYEFRVEEWSGVKHTGLPPQFESP